MVSGVNMNHITILGKVSLAMGTEFIFDSWMIKCESNLKSRRAEDKFNNRRIATWLAYLTDVEQGMTHIVWGVDMLRNKAYVI